MAEYGPLREDVWDVGIEVKRANGVVKPGESTSPGFFWFDEDKQPGSHDIYGEGKTERAVEDALSDDTWDF